MAANTKQFEKLKTEVSSAMARVIRDLSHGYALDGEDLSIIDGASARFTELAREDHS